MKITLDVFPFRETAPPSEEAGSELRAPTTIAGYEAEHEAARKKLFAARDALRSAEQSYAEACCRLCEAVLGAPVRALEKTTV